MVGVMVEVMGVGISFSGKQATKKISPSNSKSFDPLVLLKYIILILRQTLDLQIRFFLFIYL